MDPNKTVQLIVDCLKADDDEWKNHLDDYAAWRQKGGFAANDHLVEEMTMALHEHYRGK